MTRERKLEDVLEDFLPSEAGRRGNVKSGRCIARWHPEEVKAKYDRLQVETNKEFGRNLDQLVQAFIDAGAKRFLKDAG